MKYVLLLLSGCVFTISGCAMFTAWKSIPPPGAVTSVILSRSAPTGRQSIRQLRYLMNVVVSPSRPRNTISLYWEDSSRLWMQRKWRKRPVLTVTTPPHRLTSSIKGVFIINSYNFAANPS